MTKRKTLQALAQIGAVLYAVVAFVAYRISAGGGDDSAARCWIYWSILMIFAFEYYFVCINRCDINKRDPDCFLDCTIHLIIIQLVLMVAFLLCLIASGTFSF